MNAVIIAMLIAALVVGVIIFMRMSAVKFTSKEVIMNSVSEASNQLISYRFDIKGFIEDRMGMYTTSEAGALAARRTSIERKKQDITTKLAAVMKRTSEVRCQTDEFHAVVQSLNASLEKAYHQYDELYRYAVAEKRDELIEKHRAVSNFLSNFDMTSYGHIISGPFMTSAEDQYVRDARALQY